MDKLVYGGSTGTIDLNEANPMTTRTGKPARVDQSHFVGDSADRKLSVEITTGTTLIDKWSKRVLIANHVKHDLIKDEKPISRNVTINLTIVCQDIPDAEEEALEDLRVFLLSILQKNLEEPTRRVRYNSKGTTAVNPDLVALIAAEIVKLTP